MQKKQKLHPNNENKTINWLDQRKYCYTYSLACSIGWGVGWGGSKGTTVLSQANLLPKMQQNEREKDKTAAVLQRNGTTEPDTGAPSISDQPRSTGTASDSLKREEGAAGKPFLEGMKWPARTCQPHTAAAIPCQWVQLTTRWRFVESSAPFDWSVHDLQPKIRSNNKIKHWPLAAYSVLLFGHGQKQQEAYPKQSANFVLPWNHQFSSSQAWRGFIMVPVAFCKIPTLDDSFKKKIGQFARTNWSGQEGSSRSALRCPPARLTREVRHFRGALKASLLFCTGFQQVGTNSLPFFILLYGGKHEKSGWQPK